MWVMCVILILIHSIATLIIGPTTTMSSKLLKTPATALASVAICLISLKIGFAAGAILSTVLLKCTSLKSIILKLMLIILRSLASVSLCETSKLLVTALTIQRSVAMILTWGSIIVIVIIIVRAIIHVRFICLLGFRWVLSLFLRFSFPLPLVCFSFAPLNGGGISPSSLSTKCAICEYSPSTVAPVAISGIAGVGGSHFHIMYSRDFALSFTSAQSLHIIKCVCIIVGIVSMNFSFLASSF